MIISSTVEWFDAEILAKSRETVLIETQTPPGGGAEN
jgi:hypothetical protein